MRVDLVKRARAMLSAGLFATAILAAIVPLAPAQAQCGGGQHGPTGGDFPMPPVGGFPDGPPGGPGGGPDNPDYPGNYPWQSKAVQQRSQFEQLRRLHQQPTMPFGSTADAGEQYIADELVIAVPRAMSGDDVKALLKRFDVYLIEQEDSEVGDANFVRARILDKRSPLAVSASIAADKQVILAQPNNVFRLQRAPAAPQSAAPPPLQYSLARLRLPQAHGVARGDAVLVGMIDSAVDPGHPDLAGTIAAIFDATAGGPGSHPHGTAVASLIAGHGKMIGSAPAARLLVARAFDSRNAKGNSFTVLKSIDWLAGRGARIINMSFAGPSDPAVRRLINGAYGRGIILIAAAGNAGPSSPPLYPAAEPKVITVTATDASDRLYGAANRGGYIAVAAPGVDVFVAAPDGGYGIESGTSFSAAEVSGIAALMIQRRPKLAPDMLRGQLIASARAAGAGVKVADAYRAVTAGTPPSAGAKPKLRR